MKIVNKEKTIEDVKALIEEVNAESKNKIELSINESKEDSGTLWFTFNVKTVDKFKNFPVAKVALYMFESTGKVSTFIVNGRSMRLLFENATINSPEIAVHYLKSILLREIEWTAKMESTLKESANKKPKKRSNGGNKGKGKGSYNRGDNNKSYSNRKPQGPGKPSRQFRGNSNSNDKRPYNGGQNRSYGRNSSSGINIRTTKDPYKNSNH